MGTCAEGFAGEFCADVSAAAPWVGAVADVLCAAVDRGARGDAGAAVPALFAAVSASDPAGSIRGAANFPGWTTVFVT